METKKQHYEEDEITLKELFQVIGKYFKLLWRNKHKVLFFLIPVGAFFTYQYVTDVPTYRAEVTFMINEEEGGGVSAIGGILGQFGFGGSSGKFNQKKVPFLVKSDRILRQVLFDTCIYHEQKEFIINAIKNEYSLNKRWAKDSAELLDYHFNVPIFDLDSPENTVYKKMTEFVLDEKTPLLSGAFNENNAVFTIAANTKNPRLSIILANATYDNLSEYYISKATERQKASYDLVRAKKDSVEAALRAVEYSIANYSDQNRSTWSNTIKVQRSFLEQERLKLGAMLQELVKNYGLAEYSLKSQTPFFQVIDRPYMPIESKQMSIVKTGMLVCIISGFLFVLFIIGRQIISENT